MSVKELSVFWECKDKDYAIPAKYILDYLYTGVYNVLVGTGTEGRPL